MNGDAPGLGHIFYENYQIGSDTIQLSAPQRRRGFGQGQTHFSDGYNGAPAGMAHCEEAGCLRDQLHIPSGERHELCRGLHAEQNAIIQAARQGTEIKDSTLYCTTAPCSLCAKMLINAGVTRIVYEGSYPDERAMAFFAEAGVKVEHFVLEEDEQ